MPDNHGFEVVLEAAESVLLKVLQGAWKSAECPADPGDEGRIPEFMDLPAGLAFGGYQVVDGQVQIPKERLAAEMATDVNGAALTLGLDVQAEIADPPVPSAGLFDMSADVTVRAPIGTLPSSKNVGVLLDGIPRSAVTTTLTSGDPLAAKLDTLLAEAAHAAYENGSPGVTPDPDFPTIPHEQDEVDVVWTIPFGSFTVDVHVELYDDPTDPARRIEVTRPDPSTVRVSIPIYLRIFNIRAQGSATLVGLQGPMGIETRLVIAAPFESPPGSYTLRFDTATVTTEALVPAPGVEGTNYADNKAKLPILDATLSTELVDRGTELAHAFGPVTIPVPTVAEIETAIGDAFHEELESRGFIAIWTPEGADAELEVTDVTTRALDDALVIALNAGGGADIGAMTNFIPADREFAISLSGGAVAEMIDQARADNGFADSDLPKRMHEGDNDVDLNDLDVDLTVGALRISGDVTVIDAVLGSIDVDADFTANVGLHWEPNAALDANGVQMMKHHMIGDPDVDPEESVAMWVITLILAVISFGAAGLLGLLILGIVILIVQAIASKIGSATAEDAVSGALEGITAWPPNLSKIGTVTAVFHDPIAIDPSGILLAGTLTVVSSCESVQVLAADSGSAYSVAAATPVSLAAHATSGLASYQWSSGDGGPSVAAPQLVHSYDASGLYVAKHSLTIQQPGGATSRHFALVDVRNVPPTVDAGADVTVDEGEVVTLVGTFEDVEYADTHESMWNFGDDQATAPGVLAETNDPPAASGTSTVEHAWCDNGEYVVTFTVRDHNGGIASDTRTVTVLNVAPTVDAGPEMFAYPCTVLTLTGGFTDPGWCDTHEGTWEFGDCTPVQMAVVTETNEPPAATGIVVASHVYDRCGTYSATCTVTDDDGGVGRATTLVRVIDVANKDFEGGFRQSVFGTVANAWGAYVHTTPSAEATTGAGDAQVFFGEQYVVHSGQRSQGIHTGRGAQAGIHQRVGANPGWEYQVVAWYSLEEGGTGSVRLGVDPAGGDDPTAPSVSWTTADTRGRWDNVTARTTATGRAVTIFLEAVAGDSDQRDGAAFFDDVELVPVQPFCPPSERPPELDEKRVCVDFRDVPEKSELPPDYEKDGFTFHEMRRQGWLVVSFGDTPPGLVLFPGGIVDLPFEAEKVEVHVTQASTGTVGVVAIDAKGDVVGRGEIRSADGIEGAATIDAPGAVRVYVTTKNREAALVQVCATPRGPRPGGKRPAPQGRNWKSLPPARGHAHG